MAIKVVVTLSHSIGKVRSRRARARDLRASLPNKANAAHNPGGRCNSRSDIKKVPAIKSGGTYSGRLSTQAKVMAKCRSGPAQMLSSKEGEERGEGRTIPNRNRCRNISPSHKTI